VIAVDEPADDRGHGAGRRREDQAGTAAEVLGHDAGDRAADRSCALQGNDPQRDHPAAHGRLGAELQRAAALGEEADADRADQEQRDELQPQRWGHGRYRQHDREQRR